MHLACCQLEIAWEDKEANFGRVAALVAAADLPPGALLLLPEMFATGFTMNADRVAEPSGGRTAVFLADLARRHGIWVQAGVAIRDATDSRPKNETLAFSPEGRLMARYAKIHLFSVAGEPKHYAPGDSPAAFPWEQTVVAPAICYDLRFPELFREGSARGAEVFSVIACWPAVREEHWLALLRARAIENQCYVAAANRCGADPLGPTYSGRSQASTLGEESWPTARSECVIQARLDLEELRRYRREFPVLGDIRLASSPNRLA